MNIVYFGTDVFIDVFRHLTEEHNILALYTYHNTEDYFGERGIVQLAHLSGIPVHYTKITEGDIRRYIRDEDCELFFVAEYCSVIPVPEDEERFRGINIHSSLLPQGRSYYPIECVMSRGLRRSGVTLHKIAPKVDCGDIIAQKSYRIEDADDSIDVYLKCGRAALKLVRGVMNDFDAAWNAAKPQNTHKPYWKRPDDSEMTVTHRMTVSQAAAIYRAFNKMTMVRIDGLPYYINGFATGNVRIGSRDTDVIFVSDSRVLYGLSDGHIRIDIEAVENS